jgi:hypothetical protein
LAPDRHRARNLREPIEQAAAYSGADDELVSQRDADQESWIELLMKRRDALSKSKLSDTKADK